jgi:hypothetical protein
MKCLSQAKMWRSEMSKKSRNEVSTREEMSKNYLPRQSRPVMWTMLQMEMCYGKEFVSGQN